MEIQVQVSNEEIDLNFQSDGEQQYDGFGGVKKIGEYWSSLPNQYNATVDFVNDGFQVVSVNFTKNITLVDGDEEATRNLLITRIQEKLKEVINSRDSGVEYTGETAGITPLTHPKPYDPDKIKVRQDKFSVEYIVNKMIHRGTIDLNPEFQRKFVWDKKRQSNLVESLMLGIPIPVFYLAEGLNGTFHVIDGLQRLSTLRDFLNNNFSLRNLEHLSDYDGCSYTGDKGAKKVLPHKMLTRIETAQLHFNIIEASSPSEVKFDIFTRLNTGGQPLNNQEVRNCLAEPHVRKFLNSCAESIEFKNATGNSIKSKRMEDQEMVLRFSGFYLQKLGLTEYTGDMSPFLNDILDLLNNSSNALLSKLETKFKISMSNAYQLFGIYSFRKCTPNDLLPSARKQYINKSMFVAWSVLLADLDEFKIREKIEFQFLAKIVANSMLVLEKNLDGKIITRYSEYFWLFTSGTSDKKSLNTASNLTSKLIKEYLVPIL